MIPVDAIQHIALYSDSEDAGTLMCVSREYRDAVRNLLQSLWQNFSQIENVTQDYPYLAQSYREWEGRVTLVKIRELYNGILHLKTIGDRRFGTFLDNIEDNDEDISDIEFMKRYLPKQISIDPQVYMHIENERWRHLPRSIRDQFAYENAENNEETPMLMSSEDTPESFLKWIEDSYPSHFMCIHTNKVLMPSFFEMSSKRVTSMKIAQCALVSIPTHAFKNFPKLKKLFLNHNELRSLPRDLFSNADGSFTNPDLRGLWLNGNPFSHSSLPIVPEGCEIVVDPEKKETKNEEQDPLLMQFIAEPQSPQPTEGRQSLCPNCVIS